MIVQSSRCSAPVSPVTYGRRRRCRGRPPGRVVGAAGAPRRARPGEDSPAFSGTRQQREVAGRVGASATGAPNTGSLRSAASSRSMPALHAGESRVRRRSRSGPARRCRRGSRAAARRSPASSAQAARERRDAGAAGLDRACRARRPASRMATVATRLTTGRRSDGARRAAGQKRRRRPLARRPQERQRAAGRCCRRAAPSVGRQQGERGERPPPARPGSRPAPG